MGHTFDPITVELSVDATWTAEESIPLGPWRLRATHGYSHRANSVRTIHSPIDADYPHLIEEAEAFYRARNLPPMFQISPATTPSNLDDLLAARGYAIEVPSQVWCANPADVVAATRCRAGIEPILREDPDEGWLHCAHDDRIGRIEIREQICRRIPAPRAFVTVYDQGSAVARALGAIHSNIAWLYCMATVPTHFRRGLATRMIHALADWAIAHSAQQMYLQVLADNVPAQALYAQAAFKHRYNYHYRVRR